MKKFVAILIAFIIVSISNSALADLAVYDNFTDETLDPAWMINFQDAEGWIFTESGTDLEVTDIDPTVINHGSGGTWAKVVLSQSFTPLNNFNVDFKFSWDSEDSVNAMQNIYICLYDVDNNKILVAGYCDAWVDFKGGRYAEIGTNTVWSGFDSMPLTATASVNISRTDNKINILWNGSNLMSDINATPISSVSVEFDYYAYEGHGVSYFGNESVDLVRVEGPPDSVEMNLPKGWSMISLPVVPENLVLSDVFPGAMVVYRYERDSGYVRVEPNEELKVGEGYWIFLNEERPYTLTGTFIPEHTMPVEDGWYMIGGCTHPAEVTPHSCNSRVIYGYTQGLGYQRVTDHLERGKGYWILLNNAAGGATISVETVD